MGTPFIPGPGALSDHQRLHGSCVLRYRGPRPISEATLDDLSQTQPWGICLSYSKIVEPHICPVLGVGED